MTDDFQVFEWRTEHLSGVIVPRVTIRIDNAFILSTEDIPLLNLIGIVIMGITPIVPLWLTAITIIKTDR